ncbi:MAG: hypothetical protein J7J01_08115 [Methanophagales archaeon]|nr:hypothetical protein [Methanophagales archaeon]
MNSIDMSEVEKKYQFRFTPGNPAYSRQMLLRMRSPISGRSAISKESARS